MASDVSGDAALARAGSENHSSSSSLRTVKVSFSVELVLDFAIKDVGRREDESRLLRVAPDARRVAGPLCPRRLSMNPAASLARTSASRPLVEQPSRRGSHTADGAHGEDGRRLGGQRQVGARRVGVTDVEHEDLFGV